MYKIMYAFGTHILCAFQRFAEKWWVPWDPQVLFSAKTTLKLGHITLFTHLKIILL